MTICLFAEVELFNMNKHAKKVLEVMLLNIEITKKSNSDAVDGKNEYEELMFDVVYNFFYGSK